MNEETKTYKLKLRCLNCYRNFNKEFRKGFFVEERGYTFDAKHIWDEKDELIECPNCGCTNIIKVTE
jgi:DNA-directed RNA polymerase subunit RPC12/RpoP